MKKIFLISASLFILTMLFLGVYNFAFRNNPRNATVDEEKREAARQEEAQAFVEESTATGISTVTDRPAYGAVALDDSHIAYFNDRSLKRSALSGGGEEILVRDLPGKILRASWAPDREQVLVLFGTGQGDRWFLIRLRDSSVTPLKSGITSPTWSNLSERIFYLYTDPISGKTELDSANPDGSDWKTISPIPAKDTSLTTVPASSVLSFWNKPSAFEETALYTVPATGGTPTRIFSKKFGADYLWSPDGTRVLISNTLSRGGSEVRLGTANRDGGEFRTVQAPTIVSKAAWSKDGRTVYYALPLSVPENAVLPNDYFSRPIHTEDSFWKMDILTGKSDRLIDPEHVDRPFDSTDLFLDPNEEFLYFTDRVDEKIHRLSLR